MDDTYLTTDTWLAAFIIASGVKIDRLEPHGQNRRKIQFYFAERDRCMELFSEYHAGSGSVAPLKYKQVFEGLMEQIHHILKTPINKTSKA